MSLGDAVERLGFSNVAQLRRYLLHKEKSAARQFMVRRGGMKRPRYYVTIGVLREECPELFATRADSEATKEGEAVLESITGFKRFEKDTKQAIEHLAKSVEAIVARLTKLEASMARVGSADPSGDLRASDDARDKMKALENRIAALSKRMNDLDPPRR